jgi:predicted nucleic acid-binding protein
VSVFADTSAFYALLVRSDEAHGPVRAAFTTVIDGGRPLWTTSFVIVETMALLQHRIGMDAARDFDDSVLPMVRVHWVDEHLYRLGVDRLWRADRRHVSLVDCVSFEFMVYQGIETALAVDPDFADAGFSVMPTRSESGRR